MCLYSYIAFFANGHEKKFNADQRCSYVYNISIHLLHNLAAGLQSLYQNERQNISTFKIKILLLNAYLFGS